MKKLIALLLAMVMVLGLLAGCSAGKTTTDTPAADSTPSADTDNAVSGTEPSADASRDTVIVADWLETSGFNPDASMAVMCVTTQLYDPLWMAYSGEEFQYRIAESREWVDGEHCKVKLREDVYDHAGNHITASDVIFSIKLAQGSGGSIATCMSEVLTDECVIEGDYDLTIVLANGTTLNDYNFSDVPIVSQKAFEESPDGMVLTPVGTGPYKLGEFVSGSHVVLDYFEDYYRLDEAPQIQHVKIMFTTDASQRTNVLLGGEADFAVQLPFTDLATVEGDSNLKTYFEKPSNQFALLFNNGSTSPFYQNAELRKAVAYAIDNAAFSAVATLGNAQVAQAMGVSVAGDLTQETFDLYKDTGYYAYDLEKAKECVANANVPEGTVIKMSYGYTAGHDRLAEMVQAACLEIGLTVELEFQPDWLTNLFANPEAYDMTIISWQGNPAILNYSLFGNIWHLEGVEEAKFWELYAQAMYDTSGTNQYMPDIQQYFYENCFSYGIYDDACYDGMNKNLNIVMRCPLIPEYCEWTFD